MVKSTYELEQSIFYKITYAPSEDSDQPVHLHPRSLISVSDGHFVDSEEANASTGGQQRLISLGGCVG